MEDPESIRLHKPLGQSWCIGLQGCCLRFSPQYPRWMTGERLPPPPPASSRPQLCMTVGLWAETWWGSQTSSQIGPTPIPWKCQSPLCSLSPGCRYAVCLPLGLGTWVTVRPPAPSFGLASTPMSQGPNLSPSSSCCLHVPTCISPGPTDPVILSPKPGVCLPTIRPWMQSPRERRVPRAPPGTGSGARAPLTDP